MERAAAATSVVLGERFRRALDMALELHARQRRKGSGTPYVGHLLGVAAIVIDARGSEEEASAALLHDAAEDQGGRETLALIERELGGDVAAIVESLSDTFEASKPAWRKRKEDYIAHVAGSSDSAALVSLADKLYNARAILLDYRDVGDEVWSRFSVGRDEVLWYYEALADAYAGRRPGALAEELARTVTELRRAARAGA